MKDIKTKITHGPHIGRITSNSVRIWLRLSQESYARIQYSTALYSDISEENVKRDFTNNKKQSNRMFAKKEDDFIVNIPLSGLKSNSKYVFQVELSDDGNIFSKQNIAGREFGYFQTFPPENEYLERELVFAFGSCFFPHEQGDHIFIGLDKKSRDEYGFRFLLLLGDQVYADYMPGELINETVGTWKTHGEKKEAIDFDAYKYVYRSFWSSIPFRQALMRIPTFMIFDDHEFRNDWGLKGENKSKDFNDQRAAALKAYELYQHNLNPPTKKNQYWYTFNFGNIGFFVLDTRTERHWRIVPRSKSIMFDENQMNNLYEWLKKHNEDYPIKFIISSVPIIHLTTIFKIDIPKVTTFARDQWSGFKTQRGELVRFIFDNKIKGVHFLSGDVHMSHVAKITKETSNIKIFSFTSSPFAAASPPQQEYLAFREHISREFKVVPVYKNAGGKNFGVVRISPSGKTTLNRPYDVTCEFYDIDAKKFFEYPGKATIIIDVDRTLTSNILKRNSPPLLNASQVVNSLHKKFRVLYISSRPRAFREIRDWLRYFGFPTSHIIFKKKLIHMILFKQYVKYTFLESILYTFWNKEKHKEKLIKYMKENLLCTPVIGIGDRKTDAEVYINNGMIPIIISNEDKSSFPKGTINVRTDSEPTIWEEIERIIIEEIGSKEINTRRMKNLLPEDISEYGIKTKNGNCLSLQPYMTPHDYSNEMSFLNKIDGYFKKAKEEWLNENTIVVLPEYIGTWLVACNEKQSLYHAKSLPKAMKKMIFYHFLSFVIARFSAKGKDKSRDAVFRMKAKSMAEIYHRTFSTLAKKYGVTIVAGSIVLPSPYIENGVLISGRGPLNNVSVVYGPDGNAFDELVYKAFPTAEELSFTKPVQASKLPVFETKAGRLGVLICADSWYSDSYNVLKQKKCKIIAVPCNLTGVEGWWKIWEGYNPPKNLPNDVDTKDIDNLKEGKAWLKYSLPGRIKDSKATYGINVFLKGNFWDEISSGHSIFVKEQTVIEAEHVKKASLINFWL